MEEANVPSLSDDKDEIKNEIPCDAGQKISRVFIDCMTKIAKFDELVDLGKRFLVKFYQEVVHSCEQGLQDHLKKVKNLLDEFECLSKDAYAITRTTNESTSFILENYSVDDLIHEDEVYGSLHLQDKSISYACMIMGIYGMLKLDYAMQEKIIHSVGLNTPSLELESYCLMWDLRPYINDSIMRLAWKFVP